MSSEDVLSCRMLVPTDPVFRKMQDGSMWSDGSILPYTVTEVLSRGGSELLLTQRWRYGNAPQYLDRQLYARLRFVEETRYAEIADELLEPIRKELGIIKRGGAFTTERLSQEEFSSRFGLYYPLEGVQHFLLGMEKRAAVDIKLVNIKAALEQYKDTLTTPSARASISTLMNVFSVYRQCEVGRMRFVSVNAEAVHTFFSDVISDVRFGQYSRAMAGLGIPKSLSRSLRDANLYLRRILRRRVATGILNYGTELIATAMEVPAPSPDIIKALSGDFYLPPIISLELELAAARRLWNTAAPEFVPPSGFHDICSGYRRHINDPESGPAPESRALAATRTDETNDPQSHAHRGAA